MKWVTFIYNQKITENCFEILKQSISYICNIPV